MSGPIKRNLPPWVIIISAFIIPGSGHVLLGRAARGLFLILWMFFFGYITFQLTAKDISIIGRLSGGLAIWALSLVEVYRLTTTRKK